MVALLRRLFPSWRRRLGLAGRSWNAKGAWMLCAHIAETSWGRGIGR